MKKKSYNAGLVDGMVAAAEILEAIAIDYRQRFDTGEGTIADRQAWQFKGTYAKVLADYICEKARGK